jgi:uncharacterized protein
MKCPNCNETLVMADRNGVEIDYCPSCRGVWLDRGELDKILERSAEHYSHKENYREDYYRKDDDYNKYPPNQQRPYPHRKKKSFLGDFFDFD